jgi:hypothetical protein
MLWVFAFVFVSPQAPFWAGFAASGWQRCCWFWAGSTIVQDALFTALVSPVNVKVKRLVSQSVVGGEVRWQS